MVFQFAMEFEYLNGILLRYGFKLSLVFNDVLNIWQISNSSICEFEWNNLMASSFQSY